METPLAWNSIALEAPPEYSPTVIGVIHVSLIFIESFRAILFAISLIGNRVKPMDILMSSECSEEQKTIKKKCYGKGNSVWVLSWMAVMSLMSLMSAMEIMLTFRWCRCRHESWDHRWLNVWLFECHSLCGRPTSRALSLRLLCTKGSDRWSRSEVGWHYTEVRLCPEGQHTMQETIN